MGCNIKEAAKTFKCWVCNQRRGVQGGRWQVVYGFFNGTSKTVCNRMFIFPADKFSFAEWKPFKVYAWKYCMIKWDDNTVNQFRYYWCLNKRFDTQSHISSWVGSKYILLSFYFVLNILHNLLCEQKYFLHKRKYHLIVPKLIWGYCASLN